MFFLLKTQFFGQQLIFNTERRTMKMSTWSKKGNFLGLSSIELEKHLHKLAFFGRMLFIMACFLVLKVNSLNQYFGLQQQKYVGF